MICREMKYIVTKAPANFSCLALYAVFKKAAAHKDWQRRKLLVGDVEESVTSKKYAFRGGQLR